MAQPAVSNINMNGVSASECQNQGDKKTENDGAQQQQPQPNVRHIPIFVEGRDEPLLNTSVPRSPSDGPIGARQPSPTVNDLPKPGSIYNRVKDIPVRTMGQTSGRTASPSQTIPINVVHTSSQKDGLGQSGGFSPNQHRGFDHRQPHQEQPQVQRSNSRAHTIPIKVEHSQSQRESSRESVRQPSPSMPTVHKSQQNQTPQGSADQVDSKSYRKPHPGVQQSLDAITKIQRIQQDVLALMGRVEQFKGGARTDKEYLYLDEMLTQNLLKLDTIDAEGKDNIKAARKEAIKCINKCIAVLEAKTDMQGNSQSMQQSETTPNEGTQTNQTDQQKQDQRISAEQHHHPQGQTQSTQS